MTNKVYRILILILACSFILPGLAFDGPGQIGIWTSSPELLKIPMSGPAWQAVLAGANQDCSRPDVSDQDDNTNAFVLAAAIVYARTGELKYKEKVEFACKRLAFRGKPGGRTLAWARETGAYAMAADLVGFRTREFEAWLHKMAEVYVASDDRTMLKMFKNRSNNWGAHAFGSLCAIYRYLGNDDRLREIREYWIQAVMGPNPGLNYGNDTSWHADQSNLRWINPAGAVKQGLNIDGLIPDDMRRGATFRNPPKYTNYVWEGQQGLIMAARILERAEMSIWDVADKALYRAAYALQVRLVEEFGPHWKAKGDDLWMLPFIDEAYGSRLSSNEERLWYFGKNTGWGYVTLVDSARPTEPEHDDKASNSPGFYLETKSDSKAKEAMNEFEDPPRKK